MLICGTERTYTYIHTNTQTQRRCQNCPHAHIQQSGKWRNPQNPSCHLDCHFRERSVEFFLFRVERKHRDKAIFSHRVTVNFLSYVPLFARAFSAVRQKANQRLLPSGQVTPAWTKRESNIIPSLSVPHAHSPSFSLSCSKITLVLVIWKLEGTFLLMDY